MTPRIALMKHDDSSFQFASSGYFCSIAIFNLSNCEQYSPNVSYDCLVEVNSIKFLSNPTRHKTRLPSAQLLESLKVVRFTFSRIFSIIINNPFFIPRDYLLQKLYLLVACTEQMVNGNVGKSFSIKL